MRHIARLVVICVSVLRYGLDELALSSFRHPWVRVLVRVMTIGRSLHAPRGERLRMGLERLGPIFVKFGQVLSTRRDLLPADLADELAKLQDNVPPFPAEQARRMVESALGKPIECERVACFKASRSSSSDRRGGTAAQQSAHAGHQFARAKGFAHVVVCAQLQAQHPV